MTAPARAHPLAAALLLLMLTPGSGQRKQTSAASSMQNHAHMISRCASAHWRLAWAAGYEDIYTNKAGDTQEGSATFFRKTRYRLVAGQELSLKELITRLVECPGEATPHSQLLPILTSSALLRKNLQKVRACGCAACLAFVTVQPWRSTASDRGRFNISCDMAWQSSSNRPTYSASRSNTTAWQCCRAGPRRIVDSPSTTCPHRSPPWLS